MKMPKGFRDHLKIIGSTDTGLQIGRTSVSLSFYETDKSAENKKKRNNVEAHDNVEAHEHSRTVSRLRGRRRLE